MSKKEKVQARQQKRVENRSNLESQKRYLANYCGIGGKYSALELVITTCAKLGISVRGDIHPHQQVRWLHNRLNKKQDKHKKLKCKTMKDFYSSRAWKILRYQAFERYGNRCACCGATPSDGLVMHVDHIKPRSKNPELALDIENLQILCEDCNVGKINQWDTNWRC